VIWEREERKMGNVEVKEEEWGTDGNRWKERRRERDFSSPPLRKS